MDITTFLTFVGLVFVLVITPGPDMLYIVTTSMASGARSGLACVLGVAVGAYVHAVCVAFGLSAVLAASQTAYDVVRWGGAAYLVWIGLKTMFGPSVLELTGNCAQRTFAQSFRRGVLTNVMNPKAFLFCVTFYPQFANPAAGPVWSQVLLMGVVTSLMLLAVMTPISFSSGRFGRFLARNALMRVHLPKALGAVFVGLGLHLLFRTDGAGAAR
ncbi:LysE family translocator [Fundidesulfovibrio soli]|uniref:LysE family translocator n=1 Tax=Fundidesulfovibrio soli TaxID=2922716 RepID=UPI001FAF7D66|nr:LysE family translocator [Fundidesulfovibrio soli]